MAKRTPNPSAQKSAHASSLYQAIGGTAACRKLATMFYARVEQDSLLRPLFPGKTFRCAIEEFAAFLAQFLGGPSEDAQRRWWLSLRESHLRFKIGRKERDAWMSNMIKTLDDAQIEEPVRSALRGFFEQSSAYIVNQEQMSSDPLKRGDPPANNAEIDQEITRRWDQQRALDKAVAAIRDGDADRAIASAESSNLQACFERNRSVFAALLALMISSGESVMLDYVRGKLRSVPNLAGQRYSGRTLLHAASAAGDVTTVELLLRLGVDPNITDVGGHTPLYCVANECRVKTGANVVRALVQSGANVDADDGVKHCTALHMAARRGNIEVAEALLECGATIEARDSLGDTPLRRSVNCDKVEIARMLLSKGADVHSMGSKGLTPVLAARTSAMRQLLQSKR
ncbi:MAG TPA: ankyrin repeat domain-containing protein [Terriglobales bacterium]|nr:ankyrin repeat domain-containing protein [Terriglobales bacterium]